MHSKFAAQLSYMHRSICTNLQLVLYLIEKQALIFLTLNGLFE